METRRVVPVVDAFGPLERRIRLVRRRIRNLRSVDGRWFPRRTSGLVGLDVVLMTQGDADVVEPFEQPPPGVVVDVEGVLDRLDTVTRAHRPRLEVDRHGAART